MLYSPWKHYSRRGAVFRCGEPIRSPSFGVADGPPAKVTACHDAKFQQNTLDAKQLKTTTENDEKKKVSEKNIFCFKVYR